MPNDPGPGGGRATPGIAHGRFAPGEEDTDAAKRTWRSRGELDRELDRELELDDGGEMSRPSGSSGSGRPRERDAPCSPGVGHTPGIATTPGSPGGAHPGERDPRGSPRWGHLGIFLEKPNQNRQNHYHNRQKLAKKDTP